MWVCPALGDTVLLVRGTLFFGLISPILGGCVAWHGAFSAV